MQGSGHYKLLLFAMAVLGVVGPIMMLVRRAIWALLTSQTWNRGQTPEWVYWLSMCPAGLGYGGASARSLLRFESAWGEHHSSLGASASSLALLTTHQA